jgi:hypothetical protein
MPLVDDEHAPDELAAEPVGLGHQDLVRGDDHVELVHVAQLLGLDFRR